MKNIFLYFTFVLLISGCSNSGYTLMQEKNTTNTQYASIENATFENKIAPQDRILVEIYNGDKPLGTNTTTTAYQDDKRGFLVGNNGTVYLPLIGHAGVAGLSENQATNMLTRYYKKYLRYPFVKVSILNQKIYVLGEVVKPGVVPVINEKLNLLEVIAQAGDLTDYARRDEIKIISQVNGKRVARNIDMTNINKMNHQDLIVRPNDIVYVPPRGMKSFNVAMKDSTPLLDVIGKLLAPFVNIKYLTN